MNWQRIEPWDYVIAHVASEYKRKFNMVEIEDIKLALYEWFNEHPNKLDEWEAIGERDAKNLIYRSLRNQALDFCQEFKAKNLGYETSDLYYYEPEVIEALLPAVLRGEWGVTHKLNLGRTGRPSAPAEGNNLSSMMIEIESAYRRLSKEDQRILFLRHAESMDYKEISNFLSLNSDDAARMRGNRAVKRLVIKLGGYRPYRDSDLSNQKQPEEDEIKDSEPSTDDGNDNNEWSEGDEDIDS